MPPSHHAGTCGLRSRFVAYNVRMAFRVPRKLLSCLAVCSACASPYHPPDWTKVPRTSGVEGSTNLADLTTGQREALCIWTSSVLGGFGKRYECSLKPCDGRDEECAVSRRFSTATRGKCRRLPPVTRRDCKATVADNERCAVLISSDPCVDWASHPECRAIFSCWRRS